MSTPLKSIRAKCLDCCCENQQEVALCPAEDCPLWSFRFGKNPNIKLSEEEKARRAALVRKLTSHDVRRDSFSISEGRDTTQG